ncbi:arginase family protein [Micromonospora sp. STR1_7]|uniref:Arginase family protein n=1 Tax=Micromonospora parastrephiae TaxID=2806101 RepID=A0ABS1XSF7_9ACTN|nr:arginase family protein [Micromonospora parastrephiae]MBM0232181.1 arginase family protein [Micromonospora parastrephiae]
MRWTIVDAPLDSSGAGRGEERAPAALRGAGLLDALAADDGGRVDEAWLRDSVRDPASRVISAAGLVRAGAAITARIVALIADGRRPLVLGGDCAILPGICRALPPATELWFVDAHPDFLDGVTSPSGEAADMDLSVVTGHGPAAAIGCDGALLDPGRVHLLGHRPSADDSGRVEAARIDPAIHQLPAAELLSEGAAAVGARLAVDGDGPAWLHLDLDAVDPRDLPAVTYPEPDGLRWPDLIALVTPLARADRLLGVSVTDLNVDEDPDGRHTRRVVEVLAEVLGSPAG